MNYALIFAGGVGRRMNSKALPKQFLEIHGKPILIHTIEHFELHHRIDAICLVIVADWINYAKQLLNKYSIQKVKWIVPGGSTAMESQYLGLKAISDSAPIDDHDVVLIHDGVRPLIDQNLITSCLDTVEKYGSAVTIAPAIETIIRTNDHDEIIDTFPRKECQLARAPQAFLLKNVIKLHAQSINDNISDFIDSTSMMLFYGQKIHTVLGPSDNIKVTTPADFHICRALIEAKENQRLYGI